MVCIGAYVYFLLRKEFNFLKRMKKWNFSSLLYHYYCHYVIMIQTFHFQQVCQKTNIIHIRRDKFSIIYLKCSSRCCRCCSSTNKRNYYNIVQFFWYYSRTTARSKLENFIFSSIKNVLNSINIHFTPENFV